MDTRYLAWTMAHPYYYEPSVAATTSGYQLAPDCDWSGWHSKQAGASDPMSWNEYAPPAAALGRPLPSQGWKIHVSATHENAQRLLQRVSSWCHGHTMAFKHLPDARTLMLANSKYADRGRSGKFITIYPPHQRALLDALDQLDALIGGEAGPYILSDLRWRRGPLYVRYGAFKPSVAVLDGQRVHVCHDPEGRPHADLREPRFIVPAWAPMPAAIAAQRDAMHAEHGHRAFPYTVQQALHFSNGGGVYRALDTSGTTVILKEARPHAGLTPDLRDAVARLHHEEHMLRRLSEVPGVEQLLHAFDFHGHRFAVLAQAPGQSLTTLMASTTPAIQAGATAGDHTRYRDWALGVIGGVEQTLRRLWAAGVCFGDLHPSNILVADDGTPTLIDFEAAHDVRSQAPALMGAPGYVAPDRRAGIAGDRYSLAALKLAIFLPLTVLLPLAPGKAAQLLEWVRRRYQLPTSYRDSVLEQLAAPRLPALHNRADTSASTTGPGITSAADEPAWRVRTAADMARTAELLARGIEHTATPGRADKYYACDIEAYATGGYGLAYGAAGVLYALHTAGRAVPERAVDWLLRATDEHQPAAPGLLTGIGGVVAVLRALGLHTEAQQRAGRLAEVNLRELGDDLADGLAGHAIACLLEARQPRATTRHAARMLILATLAVEETQRRWEQRWLDDAAVNGSEQDGGEQVESGHGGLLRGATGAAIAAIAICQVERDEQFLRFAERAVQHELRHCVRATDGSLQMNEGWRSLPYLACGSAGIGIALLRLMPLLPEPEAYSDALEGILAAAQAEFVIQPGLFNGRAGLMLLLIEAIEHGHGSPALRAALDRHADALGLHALRHGHGVAFPGEQLLRISSDLATGTAGVLYALGRYARLRASSSVR